MQAETDGGFVPRLFKCINEELHTVHTKNPCVYLMDINEYGNIEQ